MGLGLDHRIPAVQAFLTILVVPVEVLNFMKKTSERNSTPLQKKALYVSDKFPEAGAESFPILPADHPQKHQQI